MAHVSFYKINNSQLNSLAIKEGQIIFVQDTGKLYIDKDSSNRISVGGASYSAGNGINISDTTISSKNSNIINGSASGSLRTINSAAENSSYTIGAKAFAEGSSTYASGSASHAEGIKTTASGNNSHAEGARTTASGNNSHAEGTMTKALKEASHAEGSSTKAEGVYSHAEGFNSIAEGISSHAEGSSTYASADSSHAEGIQTGASAEASHAEGKGTIASSVNQHAQGAYNIKDTDNVYAHIVGNGTSDTSRSNAHTIDWSGNAWFAGNIKIGGTSYSDSNAKTLIAGPASSTGLGGLKVRYDSATRTLYIRNDDSNA